MAEPRIDTLFHVLACRIRSLLVTRYGHIRTKIQRENVAPRVPSRLSGSLGVIESDMDRLGTSLPISNQ